MRTLKNGEPWTHQHDTVPAHICCDCGLEHQVIVSVNAKKKTVTLKYYRDDFATTARRKGKGIVLYMKKDKVRKRNNPQMRIK